MRQTLAEAAALLGRVRPLPVDALAHAAPRGDGHSVLVLPALLRGDGYTASMRAFLTAIGYVAHGWQLGVNLGPTRRLLDGAADRLIGLTDANGPVSLLGFSMGGLFARWLAMRMPARVQQVITVCSPMQEPAKNFWLPLDTLPQLWSGVDLRQLAAEIAQPLPVPGTFLFSRDDGIVNGAACQDPDAAADNVEIGGRHVLIARNPEVMAIVADRLARQIARSAGGGGSTLGHI